MIKIGTESSVLWLDSDRMDPVIVHHFSNPIRDGHVIVSRRDEDVNGRDDCLFRQLPDVQLVHREDAVDC